MELKTSAEWQDESHLVVLDPDGWDRLNYDYSWFEELISKEEFDKRLARSTTIGKPSWNSTSK